MRMRASNYYVRPSHGARGERVRGKSTGDSAVTRAAKPPLPAWTTEVAQSEHTRTYARSELISASWAYRKLVERHLIERGPRQSQRRVTCAWCDALTSTFLFSSARYAGHRDTSGVLCPNSYGLVLHVL